MNQICKVCGEPAAGFHFGAFTCEGCKSFFGRSYNNLSSISECKNNGKCIIDKKNRTTCKACRLRKCYTVGMSKGGSRYGRRSNWFKIHCLLQEQQQQAVEAAGKAATANGGFVGDMAQHLQQRSNAAHMSAAAQHMGSLLGYPGYLPEMSPFLSAAAAAAVATRHPANDASAAAAAALPFFSMMNGAPPPPAPPHQSAFQLPPHLLFPPYHPYRNEMFGHHHRQSIDSAESLRYSPEGARSTHSASSATSHNGGGDAAAMAERQSPLLCVAGDDEDYERTQRSLSHSAATSPVSSLASSSHRLHSPLAQRGAEAAAVAAKSVSPLHSIANITAGSNSNNNNRAVVVTMTPPASQPRTPEPQQSEVSPQPLSFAAKMQSLSPVSVCSISAETATANIAASDQECPMDLSMKTPRSSAQSFNVSGGAESDNSSSETAATVAAAVAIELRQAARRKFHQLHEENDESNDASSSNAVDEHSGDMTVAAEVKRQKFVAADSHHHQQQHQQQQQQQQQQSSYSNFTSNPTSLRGIFVCV